MRATHGQLRLHLNDFNMYFRILFMKNINEMERHLVKHTEIMHISNVQCIVSSTEPVLWFCAVMYFP
jgi:hypothetical protein